MALALPTFLDWHSISLKNSIVSVTSRTAGGMYLPQDLHHSKEWLQLTQDYLVKSGTAKRALRRYPKFLHRCVHWFLRDFRELRKIMVKARGILAPIVEARKINDEETKPDDALQWLEELSGKMGTTFDAAPYMIGLSFASNMTVTDVVMQSLLDLCTHPEYIEPIREEMTTVISSHSTGAAMPALKLLDSAIKESTRIKPIFLALARNTVQDMTLSDGTFVPAHTHMALSCERPLDPDVYRDPRTYDPYRFLRIRETLGSPGAGDGQAQLASSSSAAVPHSLFGFGHHVCPGRFYGAHFAKLLVYHVLDKYDVRLGDGEKGIRSSVAPVSFGLNEMANASAKIMVRRRR
ncbi:cytochrome p450 [Colletotrichum incanum]|uniref:Cytochrome p450 n=1 Tax=Colletotrichum incanum TaxID=1573173 RepID=A0A167BD25_COLIC|nr:cytochrome p450 [Colletotrichum incanum]